MTETDPYCWPGSDCLKNKLGISDIKQLNEVESRLASIREVQASRMILPGNYGLEHLQDFTDTSSRPCTRGPEKPGQ